MEKAGLRALKLRDNDCCNEMEDLQNLAFFLGGGAEVIFRAVSKGRSTKCIANLEK